MKFLQISPAFSKRSLASHSWLGLMIAALMYLVCISGTIAVFAQELQRWEQPQVTDSLEYDIDAIQTAYDSFMERHEGPIEDDIIIRLPTIDLPRATFSAEGQSWYIDERGNLTTERAQPITDFIALLHAELHLGATYGELVVSVLGAMLTALIISGLFAHRRLFKDGFALRGRRKPIAREVDIHNRLSVWGLPFHLMIALTGAYFGLVSLMTSHYADAAYDGDFMAVFADIYGSTPQVESAGRQLDIERALASLDEVTPGTQPVFVTIENAGTPQQFMLIGSQHMDKLIYTEQYRFAADGSYLDKVGYSDGEPGQRAIFSVYRLHFGHYGGEWMKILYGLLGLALSIIAVSGVNIWLKKRGKRDALNTAWTVVVWGAPAALAVAGLLQLMLGLSATLVFWVLLVGGFAFSGVVRDLRRLRLGLIGMTASALALLVIGHLAIFGGLAMTGVALLVNIGLIVTALVLGIYAWRTRTRYAE